MLDIRQYVKSVYPGLEPDTLSYAERRKLIYEYVGYSATDDELDELINDEDLKFMDLSEQDFLRYVLDKEIRYEDYRPSRAYNLKENRLEVDQYVNQVLNEYFPEKKEEISGYTRSGRYSRALYTLSKYALPLHKKTNLMNDERMKTIYYKKLNELKNMMLAANGGKKYDTISLEEAQSHVPTNTSAGYNYPGKKKFEVTSEALRRAKRMQYRIGRNLFCPKIPCTIAVRGHLSPVEQNKSRPVWVMPYETILLECSLTQKIYAMLKKDQSLPFITGDGSMKRLYEYLNSNTDLPLVSMDISAWDIMRGSFIIYDIFSEVLEPILNLSYAERRLYKWCVHDYVETHFMLPSGIVLSKSCGIPSGTYWTLLVNCLINWVAQSSVLEYLQILFRDLSILGDDSSFFANVSPDVLAMFANCLKAFFGMLSHPDKVEVFKIAGEKKFIGYQFKGVRLHRATNDWFKLALLPEREVHDLSISFTRVFSYLLIGGINDSLYMQFFHKYLNVYIDKLRAMNSYLDKSIFKSGPLRIFKHVMNLDLDYLANINVEKILKFNYFMMPYFFSCNYDIKEALNFDALW